MSSWDTTFISYGNCPIRCWMSFSSMEEKIREDIDSSAKRFSILRNLFFFIYWGFYWSKGSTDWPDKSSIDSETLFSQTSRECFGKRKAIENDIMSINLMQPYLTSQVPKSWEWFHVTKLFLKTMLTSKFWYTKNKVLVRSIL